MALRLFPLLMGIASLFLLYAVAKAFLQPRAIPIALALFAISHPVVRFSSEVKQYSGDVAIVLLIIYVAYRVIRSDFTLPWIAAFAAIGAISVWFSHTSVFVLAGSGTVMSLYAFRNQPWTKLLLLVAMIGFWMANFVFIFTGQSGSSPLDNAPQALFFSPLYLPFPPTSPSDIEWYLRTFFKVFHEPGGFLLSGVAAFAFILGGIGMLTGASRAFNRKIALALLVSPLLITLPVSAMGIYPLTGPDGNGARMSLFMVPILILLIAEGVEYLRGKIHSTSIGPTYLALAALLLLFPVLSAVEKVTDLRSVEEMRPLVGYIIENRRPDDAILVLRIPQFSFSFYADQLGLPEEDYIIGSRFALEAIAAHVKDTRANPRVWVTLAHNTVDSDRVEQDLLIQFLDGLGTQVDTFTAPDVRLFLYEF